MRKFIFTIFLLIFVSIISMITLLSTFGIDTKRFNNLISDKINKNYNMIDIELSSVRFKIDLKKLKLFLNTENPLINFRDENIPVKNFKTYIDFLSIIKTEPKIDKIVLILDEIDADQLKKISLKLKPSNFRSFLINRVKKGKLIGEIEFYLNNNNYLDNFIARGSVSRMQTEVNKNLSLFDTNFSFFIDKTDVLIKKFFGKTDLFNIFDGDINLKFSENIYLQSNFETQLKYNKKFNYSKVLEQNKFIKSVSDLDANLNNTIILNLDKTYKIQKYSIKSSGKISKALLALNQEHEIISGQNLKTLLMINTDIKLNIDTKQNITNLSGKYSLNEGKFLNFFLENISGKNQTNLKLDIDYDKKVDLDIINYKKPQNTIANFLINLNKKDENIYFDKIDYKESDNLINVSGLYFKKGKFSSLKKISVKTFKEKEKNNDFKIFYDKQIKISGTNFDATSLPKIIHQKSDKINSFKINKEIEIDFKNVIVPLSKRLSDFKLIGKIENGKFIKISSKGDFGENNFLEITVKENQQNQKKYLELYSDLPQPFLTEYSFFKGLIGGKLLFSSIIDNNSTNSKLKIEDFKVVNAPGMVKLLSLADLRGLADLASGDGISFETLEIKMEKNENFLKLHEILALGPSMSVLMEGYQDNQITSLKGTLVPAKTINKMISKIPVIGDIVIPKETGEGLFGISFRMKGPTGKIKTTINPIKTITPRFIQKIIDKRKKAK